MKNGFLIVSFLFVTMSVSGFASTKKKVAPRPAAPTEEQTAPMVEHVVVSHDDVLGIGFGAPILPDSGETAFGFNLGFLTRVETDGRLLVGADVGFHFWGKISPLTADSLTGLQILPTGVYELGSSETWVPYLGISAGPYITMGPNSIAAATTGTTANFIMMFRGGMTVWLGSRKVGINVESRFGEVGYYGILKALAVEPSVRLMLSL